MPEVGRVRHNDALGILELQFTDEDNAPLYQSICTCRTKEVVEIHPKWYILAEKNLDEGDEIKKTYRGKLDGQSGYLVMSEKKFLFVHEEGFLHKSYELTQTLSYDKVTEHHLEGRYELDVTDVEGNEHVFKTSDIPASVIEKSIEELIK